MSLYPLSRVSMHSSSSIFLCSARVRVHHAQAVSEFLVSCFRHCRASLAHAHAQISEPYPLALVMKAVKQKPKKTRCQKTWRENLRARAASRRARAFPLLAQRLLPARTLTLR